MLDGTSEPVTPTSGELPSDEGMKPSRFRLGRVIGVSPELPVGARCLHRGQNGPSQAIPCRAFSSSHWAINKSVELESVAVRSPCRLPLSSMCPVITATAFPSFLFFCHHEFCPKADRRRRLPKKAVPFSLAPSLRSSTDPVKNYLRK